MTVRRVAVVIEGEMELKCRGFLVRGINAKVYKPINSAHDEMEAIRAGHRIIEVEMVSE